MERTELLQPMQLAKKLKVSLPSLRKMNLPFVMVGTRKRYYWPAVEKALSEKVQ